MGRIVSAAVVSMLVAVWSVTVWACHALAGWVLVRAGDAQWSAEPLMGMSAWLPPPLIPMVQSMVEGVVPLVQGLLQWLPALGPLFTAAAWLVWALGVLVLLALGVALHWLLGWGRPVLRRGDQGAVLPSLLAALRRR